jgi:hypothetical protein
MFELDQDPPKTAGEDASAATDVLIKFDKAMRARRLYEPTHELVQRFDGDLRTALRAYLGRFGDLKLRVRPTAFEVAEQPITASGLDELALSFFRQGIIGLRLATNVPDAQVSSFLDLCNRGLQNRTLGDDDLATLLWRANLTSINYAAVLGYTEEDGSGSGLDELAIDLDSVGDALGDTLATDLEKLPEKTRKAFEERVRKMRGDDDRLSPEIGAARDAAQKDSRLELARHAFAILRAVLSTPRRSPDLSADELRRLLLTFRSVFIQHADLDGLTDLAQLVKGMSEAVTTSNDDKAALFALTKQRIDEQEFMAMLERVPGGAAGNLQKLTTVIQVLAGNDRTLIARLADLDKSDQGRGALDKMLVDAAGHDPDYLINRFRSLEGKRAVEALALMVRKDPVQARMAVAVRLPGAGDETQIELLEAIHTIPDLYDPRMRAALIRLAAKGGPLRVRIFEGFTTHHDPEVIEAVWGWVQSDELEKWDARTVSAAFRMLLSHGEEARVLPMVEQILGRKSLFGRKQLMDLKLTVIAALTASQAPETRAFLTKHSDSRDKEIGASCREALERITIERARGAKTSSRPEDVK